MWWVFHYSITWEGCEYFCQCACLIYCTSTSIRELTALTHTSTSFQPWPSLLALASSCFLSQDANRPSCSSKGISLTKPLSTYGTYQARIPVFGQPLLTSSQAIFSFARLNESSTCKTRAGRLSDCSWPFCTGCESMSLCSANQSITSPPLNPKGKHFRGKKMVWTCGLLRVLQGPWLQTPPRLAPPLTEASQALQTVQQLNIIVSFVMSLPDIKKNTFRKDKREISCMCELANHVRAEED